ncbi:uncharacterized protein NESG_01618 [Nematocida ausubeli]|uniref:Uncharacterized protein n=1 Tax=Nematocida ausubeli (strain ATCC PRA-371 / ERTm2) TaxID=1913371 RepID=A0A086J0H2_NEMA1|nr:uncharacterized protein NESG_01618 [Nematocida ausubeli]KAI5137936.1 hypothetical protein NEAUS06_2368 [Nematocida ausubeli]KFG25640.1 hypothetical protein NESG_01618 [Nematocida ausubeli]
MQDIGLINRETSKTFGGYFFGMCTLSIIYTLVSVITLRQNYYSTNSYGHQDELFTIIFETISNIIFKSFVDLQAIIYFIVTGSISFFYVYIGMQCARLIRYAIVEAFTIPNINIILYFLYIISNILRIAINIKWATSTKYYFYQRMCSVSNNNISSGVTYYSVYFMLEGCALLITNRCIFNSFLYIYTYKYTSDTDIINNLWVGITSCFCWYFLWITKQNNQKKWYMRIFFLVNIARFVFIYLTSGERRYILNTYYRDMTVSERMYSIVNSRTENKVNNRRLGLNIVDNLENFFVDLIFNIYFVWYSILLYKHPQSDCLFRVKARSSISNYRESDDQEV